MFEQSRASAGRPTGAPDLIAVIDLVGVVGVAGVVVADGVIIVDGGSRDGQRHIAGAGDIGGRGWDGVIVDVLYSGGDIDDGRFERDHGDGRRRQCRRRRVEWSSVQRDESVLRGRPVGRRLVRRMGGIAGRINVRVGRRSTGVDP